MLDYQDILETLHMLQDENLDIRTVTMGVSLLDCASDDPEVFCRRVYDKITRSAERLLPVAEQIEKKYGIPIIHKRIAVTPVAIAAASVRTDSFVPVARALDRAARQVGVNFIGGFSALVHGGATPADHTLIRSLPQALAETELCCASVNVATSRAGINLDAVAEMGRIIRQTAEATRERGSIGCAKLVVFANAPEDNPFMAGAFHGVGQPDRIINVGVSGPGVVHSALQKLGDCSITELADVVKKTAFKITRMGALVAREAAAELGVPCGIVDLSLAPTPAIGDSVAHILEDMGLEKCGTHGTTACLALLNDAVKKGGLFAAASVGGLSGAFIPVSEDAGMIDAARAGSLCLDKLEAMTAVCSVGLDMIAVPGHTSAATLSGIIADEMSIGVVNHKTTAVRLIPVIGKDVGDEVEFGGLLGTAPILPVHPWSCEKFIARGGRIPSPTTALKN